MTTHGFDWAKVLAKLRSDEWYLLGTDLPKSLYEAIRRSADYTSGTGIEALRGVEVQTRNTKHDEHGRRTSDIYLKLRKD